MASDTQGARAAIEAAISTVAGAVQVAFPNVSFTPPDDGRLWIKPAILWGEGRMVSGGAGTAGNWVTGILVLNVFGPDGEGLGDLYDLADSLRDAFTRVKIGEARFLAPSGPKEIDDPDGWAALSVSCPFQLKES